MEQLNLISPHINGELEETSNTDIEDLHDENMLHLGKKSPSNINSDCTDNEMFDGSGDEGTRVEAKSDGEGVFVETKNELVSLTEGFKIIEALCLSDGEVDPESVYGRHLKNMKKTEESFEIIGEPAEAQVPTDCESIDDLNDEMSPVESGGEDGVPESYFEQGNDVIDKEAIKPLKGTLKSSPRCKVRRKFKNIDREDIANEEEGVTDIDENDHTNPYQDELPTAAKPVVNHPKMRRKRSKQSLKFKKSKKLGHGDGDNTDSQSLSGGDFSDDESDGPKEVLYTDWEDCAHSGDEEELMPQPVYKDKPFEMPLPHYEVTQDCAVDVEAPIEQEDTDEDELNIGEDEDLQPLPKREYPEPVAPDLEDSDMEDTIKQVDTDENDSDIAEEELKTMIDEFSTWERSKDTDILEKMDCSSGTESSIGKWKGAVANVMRSNIAIKNLKSFLPTNLLIDGSGDEECDDESTDEENYDESGQVVKEDEKGYCPKDKDEEMDKTDDEDMVASDDDMLKELGNSATNGEQESPELHFVETKKGEVNAIMTLDNQNYGKIIDNVSGVQFIDNEDEEDTDVEELKSQDETLEIRIEASTPFTDMESFDGELSRPSTPIPYDIPYSVLSSPRREKIYITEDKYGIPQVRIEKIIDEDHVLDEDLENRLTDTEDVEVTLEEALKYYESPEAHQGGASFNDYFDNSQISYKQRNKVAKDNESLDLKYDDHKTDVEELAVPKRRTRKVKKAGKNQECEGGTDEEVLSDGSKCLKENVMDYPTYSTDNDTNSEDFEVSNMEDIMDDVSKSCLETPELIRKLAVKKTEIYKEGSHQTTTDVIIEPAEISRPKAVDYEKTITDTEDMDGSCAEDIDAGSKEDIEMHGDSTIVDHCENVRPEIDQDQIELCSKESLLCPNLNPVTDVESLDSVGNRQP